METRQINQVKMYFLIMNSVYQRFEDRTAVVCSYEEKNIADFYSNNRREPYRDVSGFMRYFDEDSPLYDFNPSWFDWCRQLWSWCDIYVG